MSTSQVFFWDVDLNFGRKEQGIEPSVFVVRGLRHFLKHKVQCAHSWINCVSNPVSHFVYPNMRW